MADIDDMIASLTLKAAIEESEELDDDDLTLIIEEALQEHNEALTVETLPQRESLPVVILAWANLCLVRAGRFSKDSSISGAGGIGADLDTPYRKCISLSKELRKQYSTLCSALNLSTGDVPEVSSIVAQDSEIDTMIPYSEVNMPAILLKLADGESLTVGTSWTLTWVMEPFSTFYRHRLFMLIGSEAIRQEWNYDPTGDAVNEVNNSADLLVTIDQPQMKATKVTGVNKTVTNRFLLVCENTAGKFQYSNELVLTPTP